MEEIPLHQALRQYKMGLQINREISPLTIPSSSTSIFLLLTLKRQLLVLADEQQISGNVQTTSWHKFKESSTLSLLLIHSDTQNEEEEDEDSLQPFTLFYISNFCNL